MSNRIAVPQLVLAAYGAIGLVINMQALLRGRVTLDTVLLVAAIALDAAALVAAGRFGHLVKHRPTWLERLVYAIAAFMVTNAAVAAWRGQVPFYLLVYGLYVVCGLLVWWAVLTSIRNLAGAAGADAGRPHGTEGTEAPRDDTC